ncbi:MAG: acyl-CoA carboxylase subunit beta [Eubacteriales bacterium]|nr:acyl-CoA carboxylase subunit beta [Eubacteriales bacterium]
MAWEEKYRQEYRSVREEALLGGGQKRIDREHARGKLTARERMELLFDDGIFTEIEMYAKTRIIPEKIEKRQYIGDGVVCGYGRVHDKIVYAAAQDTTVSGGAGGETHVSKISRTLEMAIRARAPFVQMCESGGARIEEGILSLSAYSRLFYLNTQASGYIPQIAAIMGNCAGGSAYSPAMCDVLLMVKETGQFFITGPRVIKALTGEDVSMNELGGAGVHAEHSGQAHIVCENDQDCINQIRRVLSFLTQPQVEHKKRRGVDYTKRGLKIENIVPENKRHPYDVREVIRCISDHGDFYEFSEGFARNLVTGFIRLEGKSIGVVANQALYMGGSLDCDAGDKCARFVRFCDCFEIPLLVLVDVPGFFPGKQQEMKGILRHGSKILYAFSEATVPKVSVIMRKAYGGAYCAMNSKAMGGDLVYAWPICELAVMGADGAVDVMFQKQIRDAEDPDAFRERQISEYEKQYLNPYFAASCGFVDEIILPEETRQKLILAFRGLENKKTEISLPKKHGNISL